MKKIISLLLILSTLFVFASCKNNSSDTSQSSVNVSALSTHDNVQALIISGKIDVAILPEPKATVAINTAKQEGFNYSIALNLSDEWSDISSSPLTMGCLAANNTSLSEKSTEINYFLSLYEASINYINDPANHESAAEMIVSNTILPKLPIAKSALTNLYGSIVYKDGAEMKQSLQSFYDAIELEQPADSFYYAKGTASGAGDKKLTVGVMNGPTGMGMAKLMTDNAEGGRYEFVMYNSPQNAIMDLKSGTLDLACLPSNAVANSANKGMPFSVAAINTLGSLYVVVKEGVTVNSINDLVGKTVYYGEPTSTTLPIFAYILKQNEIKVKNLDE